MNTEKLFYSDGHDVMVTASALKVNNKVYRLAGIIRHNLSTLSPPRAPGLLLMISGVILGFAGLFGFFSDSLLPSVDVMGIIATTNDYAILLGAILSVAGLTTLIIMKRRYAVHIRTASEDADVIVSKHREYIAQIVDGLDRALMERVIADS